MTVTVGWMYWKTESRMKLNIPTVTARYKALEITNMQKKINTAKLHFWSLKE